MINTLTEKIKKLEAPIVVGLDPTMKFVPEHIKKQAFAEYGETMKGAAEAVWLFNKGIVDAICDLVPAAKPQIAMYEQFGVEGINAFQKTVAYCKEKGLMVIGDIKRGDIGSTSDAYAVGHLGQVQVGETMCRGFDEDFATINPYLGSDGVKPFIEVCKKEKKGLFILVKTSNPSSGEFQDQLVLPEEVRMSPRQDRSTRSSVRRWLSGPRITWAKPTAMSARWWARLTRRWERFFAGSCRSPIFWCPVTARRAQEARI